MNGAGTVLSILDYNVGKFCVLFWGNCRFCCGKPQNVLCLGNGKQMGSFGKQIHLSLEVAVIGTRDSEA